MKFSTEQFFRCLADPVRLNIVMLLMHEQELCSCHLAQMLQETLSRVSRNLVLLRNKGVLQESSRELWLYYRISDDLPAWATQLLNTVYAGNQHRLTQPLNVLRDLQRKASTHNPQTEGCNPNNYSKRDHPKRDNDEHSVSMHS